MNAQMSTAIGTVQTSACLRFRPLFLLRLPQTIIVVIVAIIIIIITTITNHKQYQQQAAATVITATMATTSFRLLGTATIHSGAERAAVETSDCDSRGSIQSRRGEKPVHAFCCTSEL